MGKYTKLLINRELIDIHIGEYFIENGGEYEIEGPKVLNEGIGQNRYTLKIEGKEAMLDFFFRNSDGTTTIKPTGNEFSKEIGTKIADHIVEANNCCNIKKGVVTLENITQNQFDELKNYLASIEGVEVLAEDNHANGCGQLWKIKSQIGDKITLTYYKKSGKLVSQGYMFKLFLEVTSFLTGLGLKFEKEVNDKNNDDVFQYIFIKGEKDNIETQLRSNYVIKSLNDYGIKNLQIASQYCNWDKDCAKIVVKKFLLRYGNVIDGIICNNDEMAEGSIEALHEFGYNMGNFNNNSVIVVGIDGLEKALELIKNREMTGTVIQDPDKMTEALYLIGNNMVQSKPPLINTSYKFDSSGVTVRIPYSGYVVSKF